MSSFLYPLGLISGQKSTPYNSVVTDKFEDGTTNTRQLWAAQNFKRQLALQHDNLTLAEYRYLRSFYSQRSGNYDSFWFRDNLNRRGNINVRFAAPVEDQHDGVLFNVPVKLEEIAPIRALPEWDEVTTAAGTAPCVWFDANREFYLNHVGSIYQDTSAYDAVSNSNLAPWQAGALILGSPTAQYQTYNFSGTNWAKTASSVTDLSGSQRNFTVFAICKHSAPAAQQILFGNGVSGAGTALGLRLDASGNYTPWTGGSSESWSTARSANSPVDTFRSVCVVYNSGTPLASLYINAALIASETPTYYVSSPGTFSIGAAPDGTLKSNAAGGMANASLAHVLAFPGVLTLAQIKAVHNLLGYQYGLAVVP